jgi:hypothetical protein
MSEGSRFLDFARNDKTQNFLWRHFHRAEVYFPIDASQERFDWAAVLIGLSEAAPDAVANASVASAKQDCFAQSSITSEICRLSCSGALPQGI